MKTDGFFPLVFFSGEHKPNAGRTRNARSVEREKISFLKTLSRVLLDAACLKDVRQILDWTTQKASALDVRFADCNCYFCQD